MKRARSRSQWQINTKYSLDISDNVLCRREYNSIPTDGADNDRLSASRVFLNVKNGVLIGVETVILLAKIYVWIVG